MIKLVEKIEYVLPAHWASALINEDYSGIEDEDDQNIDDFLSWANKDLPYGHWIECVDCSEEPYFSHRNDATNLGGDVLDYTFAIYREEDIDP